jgi:hypothetical protein
MIPTPSTRRRVALLEKGRPVPYVSVEHDPGLWVDAHIEKQWKHEGRWWLSVYYFVGGEQFYRVYAADQVRPASSDERHDDQEGEAAGLEPTQGEGQPSEPIDLRRHAKRRGAGPPD